MVTGEKKDALEKRGII